MSEICQREKRQIARLKEVIGPDFYHLFSWHECIGERRVRVQIDYFEEFFNEETVDWVRRIPGPFRLILAAADFAEFRKKAAQIEEARPDVRVGFWPIVPGSYWISPFARRADIEATARDLENARPNDEVMFDLELPILTKSLFYKNLPGFFAKKRFIRGTMQELAGRGVHVSSAEYPPPGRFSSFLLRALGVSFSIPAVPYTRIVMYYTSMIPHGWIADGIQRQIRRDARRYGERFQAGVGPIAIGILGDEPVLPPADLENDLAFVRDAGVGTAVVFRLGGLNNDYMRVIESFAGK